VHSTFILYCSFCVHSPLYLCICRIKAGFLLIAIANARSLIPSFICLYINFVNRDDQHLLAHAMASDFSVAWQCLSKRTIVFLLRIKLHALKTSIKLCGARSIAWSCLKLTIVPNFWFAEKTSCRWPTSPCRSRPTDTTTSKLLSGA
jgi:hypothetical protein